MKQILKTVFTPPLAPRSIELDGGGTPPPCPAGAAGGSAFCGVPREIARLNRKVVSVLALSLLGLAAVAAPPQGPATGAPIARSNDRHAPAVPSIPEEDILDIRGPIHIPAEFPWAALMIGSIAAAGLGLGAWKMFRRPRREPPYEIALANLEKLRPLMKEGSAHAFSLAVSEVVRLFIEECLPVRAAHRTTHEFLHDLLNLPDSVLSDHRGAFEDFLTHCDLAKFARWSLTVPEMEAMLTCARTFVIAIGKPKAARKQPAVEQTHPAQPTVPAAANP